MRKYVPWRLSQFDFLVILVIKTWLKRSFSDVIYFVYCSNISILKFVRLYFLFYFINYLTEVFHILSNHESSFPWFWYSSVVKFWIHVFGNLITQTKVTYMNLFYIKQIISNVWYFEEIKYLWGEDWFEWYGAM